MVQLICCHHCELVVEVDCSKCRHSMTANGTFAACDPREMDVDGFQLIAFPKDKFYCLTCCGMDPKYVKGWHTRHQHLPKTKPCSACVVTLLRAPKRELMLADQTDMQPLPGHSPSQEPQAGAESKLLLEQQKDIALLMQQQEDLQHRLSFYATLEKRVLKMEAWPLRESGFMMEDGEPNDIGDVHPWDIVAIPLSATPSSVSEFGF